MGDECEESDDCLGALECSDDALGVCGGYGAGCQTSDDCVDACLEGKCREEEDFPSGKEDTTGPQGAQLTEQERERVRADLRELDSLIAGM